MSRVNFDHRDRAYRLMVRRLVGKRWVSEEAGDFGLVRLMARSGGYVMVRRPRCSPFVLSEKEWARMPLYASVQQAAEVNASQPGIRAFADEPNPPAKA